MGWGYDGVDMNKTGAMLRINQTNNYLTPRRYQV